MEGSGPLRCSLEVDQGVLHACGRHRLDVSIEHVSQPEKAFAALWLDKPIPHELTKAIA